MAMKTTISRDGNQVKVQISGYLDYEASDPLREDLVEIVRSAQKSTEMNVSFDFSGLHFVGSCGITNFILTLKDFNTKMANKPLYFGVKTEFRRMIEAFDNSNSFIFGDIFQYEEESLVEAESELLDTRPLSRRVDN